MGEYVKKNNTNLYQEFIIPKNKRPDCQSWAHFKIDIKQQTFEIEKIDKLPLNIYDWSKVKNHTFPSSLFNSFLRMDNEF